MLNAGNGECWEHLYNKYSSLMYGICIKITGNEKMAVEIFEQAFIEIKTKSTLACLQTSVTVCLTKLTIAAVIAYYKLNHLTHILYNTFNNDYPLLMQLYVKGNNLSHAAGVLKTDAAEAKNNCTRRWKNC